MKDVLDVQLAHDMNDAIDSNDLARLKALLNHPSLNLGVVDDAVAAGYMESLRNLKEDTGLRKIDNTPARASPAKGICAVYGSPPVRGVRASPARGIRASPARGIRASPAKGIVIGYPIPLPL